VRDEDRLVLELCKNDGSGSVIRDLVQLDNVDWAYFLHVIDMHEIAPLVLSRLTDFALPAGAATLLSSAAKEEIVKAAVTRSTMRSELAKVQAAFKEEGIECILLKGLSLDFTGLRTIKDLDILVREERIIEAIRTLNKIKYDYVGHSRTSYLKREESKMLLEAIQNSALNRKKRSEVVSALSWNNHYEMLNREKNLLLELHTNLFQRQRRYIENLETLLDHIDLFWEHKRYDPKLNCFTLSNEHSLLLMSVHMAINRSPANNTFILKLAVDIDNLVGRGVRWEAFTDATCQMGVEPFVLFSFLQIQNLLGTPIPELCLHRLQQNCTNSQLFMIRIHLKCLQSLDSYRLFYSKMCMVLKPFIFGGRLIDRLKWIFLMPILFPPKGKMAVIFSLREDSPLVYFTYLLNPFRWIYLIFKSIIQIRKGR